MCKIRIMSKQWHRHMSVGPLVNEEIGTVCCHGTVAGHIFGAGRIMRARWAFAPLLIGFGLHHYNVCLIESTFDNKKKFLPIDHTMPIDHVCNSETMNSARLARGSKLGSKCDDGELEHHASNILDQTYVQSYLGQLMAHFDYPHFSNLLVHTCPTVVMYQLGVLLKHAVVSLMQHAHTRIKSLVKYPLKILSLHAALLILIYHIMDENPMGYNLLEIKGGTTSSTKSYGK
ncbi:hypothetical protein ACJX0J_035714, partial [Zea mays]